MSDASAITRRTSDAFFEQIVLPDAKLPFFLVGHSTGGLIALASARRIGNRVERIVVSAPFLGLASTRPSPRMVRFIAGLMCLIGLGGRASRRDRDYSKLRAMPSPPIRALCPQPGDLRCASGTDPRPPTWRWVYEC